MTIVSDLLHEQLLLEVALNLNAARKCWRKLLALLLGCGPSLQNADFFVLFVEQPKRRPALLAPDVQKIFWLSFSPCRIEFFDNDAVHSPAVRAYNVESEFHCRPSILNNSKGQRACFRASRSSLCRSGFAGGLATRKPSLVSSHTFVKNLDCFSRDNVILLPSHRGCRRGNLSFGNSRGFLNRHSAHFC
jgi:hypothetical protein